MEVGSEDFLILNQEDLTNNIILLPEGPYGVHGDPSWHMGFTMLIHVNVKNANDCE